MSEVRDSDHRGWSVGVREALAHLSYVPRALRLAWSPAPGWTLAWVTLLVVQGSLPVAIVSLTRLLVDSLVATMGAGASRETVRPTIVLAVLMAGALLLMEFLRVATDWIRAAQSELVQDHISALVHDQAVAADLAFYESPEFHDRLHRARDDAANRPLALLNGVGNSLQSGITLLGLALVLVPYSAWLPLLLLISTLPALAVVLRSNWRLHEWWEESTSARRWTHYYDWMLTFSETAAEIRLFALGAHFRSAFQALRQKLRTERLRLLRDQSLAHLGASMATLAISGAAMAWMLWRALQGLVTLGDLVLFYQAFSRAQNLMRGLLGNVGLLYTNSLFLKNLFEFLDLEPRIVSPPHPAVGPALLREGIAFRQIDFRYPGSDRLALENFNLTIAPGEIVAIVGANGAGKSTLVKLLCRFYDPEAGRIELDGTDIRDLSLEELRRFITVLFQSPVQYHATAGENIALGDLSADFRPAAIEDAARGAGAHDIIAGLPRGYDTLLGKWFADGTQLSAGEWRRVALARAFVRRAQIIVLDEPTGTMDPWAETEWLERFRTSIGARTGVIVTHRFALAMHADMVHVMQQGQIVESGRPDQLLAQGGPFARSWAAQTKASARGEGKAVREDDG